MAITTEGTYQDFAYTGSVQSFTVPYTGLYKLEVWGAQGGYGRLWNAAQLDGGKGGYSMGFRELKKNTKIYIVCGGAGISHNGGQSESNYSLAGGYNGGGSVSSTSDSGSSGFGSGGGATHMVLYYSTTLNSIGQTNFNNQGYLVAGGGGGAKINVIYPAPDYIGEYLYYGGGGGNASLTSGTFGQGSSAGGGGYYGGTSAGGGSGWIGGVPTITYKGTTYSPSTSNGVNSGNGKARITFVKKGFPTITYNGTTLEGINFNGTEVDTVVFNGVTLE